MLVIRREQLFELGKLHVRRLAIEALCKHWPNRSRALGEEGLAALTEDVFREAALLRIEQPGDLIRLCNIEMALGRGWTSQEEYRKEAAILADVMRPGTRRVDQLCFAIQERLEQQQY